MCPNRAAALRDKGTCTGVPPLFTFQSVTTAYARENGEQLRTMAQHVPTKRRNRISDSKNLDNGDKFGLQQNTVNCLLDIT